MLFASRRGPYGIGAAAPAEIDGINILQATLLAMERAVAALQLTPELVQVDGNRLPRFRGLSQAGVG